MNYRDYDREVHGDEAATEVAKLEAKNEALQNRVAELERCMKEVGLLAFMRDAAPGDITAHMNRVMGSYTQRLAEYQKRVAELESASESIATKIAERDENNSTLRGRLREVAYQLRALSPGPHTGPMDAEDYVPLIAKRVAELEKELV